MSDFVMMYIESIGTTIYMQQQVVRIWKLENLTVIWKFMRKERVGGHEKIFECAKCHRKGKAVTWTKIPRKTQNGGSAQKLMNDKN